MRRTLLCLAATGAIALATPAVPAFAEAGSPASCMGHEASALSPPGSSDEALGGMPELKAFIDQMFPDQPPGAIFSAIASLHEGSHEACDEALEG